MPLGADATHPITDSLIELSSRLLGNRPHFFGRYFKGPHNPSPIQYQPQSENEVFARRGLRVLCIARQTNRVGGSFADGVADAVNNMAAIVTAFGASYLASLNTEPLIFLDTELSETQPTLSADYYKGWSTALREQGPIAPGARLVFSPAIYINKGDIKSWRALASSISRGAICYGAWVASYGRRTGAEGPPAWDLSAITPVLSQPLPVDLIAWQYAGDYEDVLDFSILPDDDKGAKIIELLIPPPQTNLIA